MAAKLLIQQGGVTRELSAQDFNSVQYDTQAGTRYELLDDYGNVIRDYTTRVENGKLLIDVAGTSASPDFILNNYTSYFPAPASGGMGSGYFGTAAAESVASTAVKASTVGSTGGSGLLVGGLVGLAAIGGIAAAASGGSSKDKDKDNTANSGSQATPSTNTNTGNQTVPSNTNKNTAGTNNTSPAPSNNSSSQNTPSTDKNTGSTNTTNTAPNNTGSQTASNTNTDKNTAGTNTTSTTPSNNSGSQNTPSTNTDKNMAGTNNTSPAPSNNSSSQNTPSTDKNTGSTNTTNTAPNNTGSQTASNTNTDKNTAGTNTTSTTPSNNSGSQNTPSTNTDKNMAGTNTTSTTPSNNSGSQTASNTNTDKNTGSTNNTSTTPSNNSGSQTAPNTNTDKNTAGTNTTSTTPNNNSDSQTPPSTNTDKNTGTNNTAPTDNSGSQNPATPSTKDILHGNSIKLPTAYTHKVLLGEDMNAITQAAKGGEEMNRYQSNAENKKIIINDLNNLSREVQTELSLFMAQLLNPIRQQWGVATYKVTEGAMNFAQDVANEYTDNKQSLFALNGHYVPGIQRAAAKYGLDTSGQYYENAGARSSSNQNAFKNITLDDLKSYVYNSIVGMLFDDAHADHGHAKALLNAMPYESQNADTDYLGVDTSSIHGGEINMHFIASTDNDAYVTDRATFAAKIQTPEITSMPATKTSPRMVYLDDDSHLSTTQFGESDDSAPQITQKFTFSQLLEGNVRQLADEYDENDVLALSQNAFSALNKDKDQSNLHEHISYDSATGLLSYDADGVSGSISPVAFAQLAQGLQQEQIQFEIL